MCHSYKVHNGNVFDILPQLEEKSIQCCITSPPYFGLRDYGTGKWEGGDPECNHDASVENACVKAVGSKGDSQAAFRHVMAKKAKYSSCPECGAVKNDAQLGLEGLPEQYVQNLVNVFREVWRVLRDDGVVFLNLGDSYATRSFPDSLKPKDLIGIPWRTAFALQADGWFLRQDIIWAKNSCMPESVTDRCTKAHEYIFLLSKSGRYYYDAEAVKEGFADERKGNLGKYKGGLQDCVTPMGVHGKGVTGQGWNADGKAAGRNRRSVWTINPQPYKGAHFAVFPPELIRPMVRAGTPEKGCCPHCGAPWERAVDRKQEFQSGSGKSGNHIHGKNGHKLQGGGSTGDIRKGPVSVVTTTGHRPTCSCPEHEPVPSTVLDPFAGSGTVGEVALQEKRKPVLIELSEEYYNLALKRTEYARKMRGRRRKRYKPDDGCSKGGFFDL